VKFTAFTTTTGGFTTYGASACGIATTKRVYCWGSNRNGELGIGTTDFTNHGVAPIAGADEFTEIHGSGSFVCGLTTGGLVRCWGAGFGAAPVAVTSSKPFRTLSDAGGCGLASDSTAYCFGTTAQLVGDARRWKSIASAPGQDPCAVAPDDSVYCGTSLQVKQTMPQPVVRLGMYAPSFLADIGLTYGVCGLTSTGELRCANGGWALVNVPVKLNSFFGSCAIAVDQKVYCRQSNAVSWVVVPGQ
jgi:hypothetical protein